MKTEMRLIQIRRQVINGIGHYNVICRRPTEIEGYTIAPHIVDWSTACEIARAYKEQHPEENYRLDIADHL